MQKLPTVAEFVKKYDLTPKKSLGQNFLFDQSLTDKIVKYAGNLEGKTVIEIGPGPGALTRSILDTKPKKLILIEQDQRFFSIYNELKTYYPNQEIIIINEDALKVDYTKLVDNKAKIIANLPYNISTVLLFKWLDYTNLFESMTLMFQKEVAERIIAKTNDEAFGKISVMAQMLCDTEYNFTISPKAFYPPPKIYSSVITLIPRNKLLYDTDLLKLSDLCQTLFSQRRKMLRKSLKSLTNNAESLLEELAIDPTLRPENLSIEDFCKINDKL